MGSVVLNGATSGSTTLTPTDAVTATLTLPSTTGTLLTSSGTIATATNLAGGSNGTIPYQSASGTTQMLAVGTSGQVLQTNGAGAPSWVTPSSGAMTLLATINSTSGTTVAFDGYFTSAYDVYMIVGSDFLVDDTYVGGYLRAQVAVASTYQTSSYRYNLYGSSSTQSSMFVYSSSNNSVITLNQLADIYRGSGLVCYIYNPLATNSTKSISWTLSALDSSNNVYHLTQGGASWLGSSSALSGIKFFWNNSPATFQSGKFQLYGLKNS
jgi:hypothetical protein